MRFDRASMTALRVLDGGPSHARCMAARPNALRRLRVSRWCRCCCIVAGGGRHNGVGSAAGAEACVRGGGERRQREGVAPGLLLLHSPLQVSHNHRLRGYYPLTAESSPQFCVSSGPKLAVYDKIL